MTVLLGAIADDFTGATDLANTLVNEGMRTVQIIGVPGGDAPLPPEAAQADAVVVALKSRTIPAQDAVAHALAALSWLQAQGAQQIVFKYCSTFDSTADGNIGPVADALQAQMGAGVATVCPAFPANGRTIYQGHLFVGADLLSDSSMKDHPLTPMRDASLLRLMAAQSMGSVGLVPLDVVRAGADAIRSALADVQAAGHAYAVTDALSDDDLRQIGAALDGAALITGGSGIATGLPDNFRTAGLLGPQTPARLPQVPGRAAVLAGSCSTATRAQIAHARAHWPTAQIDVDALAAGQDETTRLANWALSQDPATPVVIYASAAPDAVAQLQARHGRDRAGALVEACMGALAQRLSAGGVSRLIVAGGETSGAVVSALSIQALRIGPEIAPGVPWTEPLGEAPMALALKSGNFGSPAFFADALDMLP
ncbi:MAG: 3-oxo-tetronate kinase [Primorskyibacter sp.]